MAPLLLPGAGGLENAAKLTWNRGRATINGLAAEDSVPEVGDTPKPWIVWPELGGDEEETRSYQNLYSLFHRSTSNKAYDIC